MNEAYYRGLIVICLVALILMALVEPSSSSTELAGSMLLEVRP